MNKIDCNLPATGGHSGTIWMYFLQYQKEIQNKIISSKAANFVGAASCVPEQLFELKNEDNI